MISKLSWILFIPLTLAAIFFKLAQTVLPDNAIFGWSDQTLDYVVIGCVALVFLFSSISVLSVLAGDIVLTKVDPRISLTEKAGRS